jgi:hypothetical protein
MIVKPDCLGLRGDFLDKEEIDLSPKGAAAALPRKPLHFNTEPLLFLGHNRALHEF